MPSLPHHRLGEAIFFSCSLWMAAIWTSYARDIPQNSDSAPQYPDIPRPRLRLVSRHTRDAVEPSAKHSWRDAWANSAIRVFRAGAL
jgi:hypothetical protein